MRQQKPAARTIVHLLQYCPERRATNLDLIEDIVPLRDVEMSIQLKRKPARVYLAPQNEKISFEFKSGRAHVRVPEVRGHAMVVFE